MKSIFFVSDKTGITMEMLGNALLTQFDNSSLKKESIPSVDTLEKADFAILKIHNRYLAPNDKPVVFTSIINHEIRAKFKLDYVCHIDFFDYFIPTLEKALGQSASYTAGMSHGIADEHRYYERIEAINFAMYNDDGVTAKNYAIADVILVGVSRVGKTPTCVYMAVNYGLKAANYPFAENDLMHDNLPKILSPYQNKIFGLTIDAERLHHIRTERLPNTKYADIKNCEAEILAAENIMHHYNIPYLNTSKKSIEEISVAIIQKIALHRHML